MRKLRKLFKFIPLLCLPLLCGLSVFGLDHHNIKETKADDDLSLVSSHAFNDFEVDYTVNSATVHLSFDLKVNVYRYMSDVTKYRFDLGMNELSFNDFTFSYAGNTYSPLYSESFTDRWYYITYDNVYINGTYTTPNISLSFLSSYLEITPQPFSSTDSMFDYYFNFRVALSYPLGADFTSSVSSMNFRLPSLNDSTHGIFGLLFPVQNVPHPLNFVSTILVGSYNIDLTYNNYDLGFNDGYSVGFNAGYDNGYVNGYQDGSSNGYSDGYSEGYSAGASDGYSQGYTSGYDEAVNQDEVVNSIFSGILQVGFLPVEFFLAIFNFEILGINLTSVVASLLTICFTLLIIKAFKGFM